MNFMTV